MERPTENSEAQRSFAVSARRAINTGCTPDELKALIDEEARALSVGDDIRKFFLGYIAAERSKVSAPEDFDSVATGMLENMRDWHHKPDMTLEEAKAQIFNKWNEAERGLAYLASNDNAEVDMYFKGSDGQLYVVPFDLNLLRFPSLEGERAIGRDQLHEYLLAYSPFKAFASTMNSFGPGGYDNTPNKGFRESVEKLLEASRQRTQGDLLRQKEISRHEVLDQLGV